MPEILVKEFSAIATSSGVTKITKIKNEKNKAPYQPAQDFYKQLREAIIACHEKGKGISHVQQTADKCSNPDKKPKFEQFAKAYIKWVGKTPRVWSPPPRSKFSANGFDIIINPELCFSNGAGLQLIKLYFNQEPIKQATANFILHLMESTTKGKFACALLDVKRGKVMHFTGSQPTYATACMAEVGYIASVWPTV